MSEYAQSLAAAFLAAVIFLAGPSAALQARQDAKEAKEPSQQKPPPDPNDPWLPPPPPQQATNLTPTLLDRASATVSVITGQDLRTLGVRSLTDSLRIIPGLEVQKISATESGVSVRGYSGPGSARQGILGLVDGRQVYNEFFGGVFWESLPVCMEEIKAIEVIRGPSSFLYGPNAMHGFVNIVTKSPLDYSEGATAHHEVFLSAAGGSYASNVESMTYVKREGDSGLKVTIAHDDIDQFEGSGDTRNKVFADLRFKTRLDEHQELELSGGISHQKFDVYFPPIFLSPTVQLHEGTFTVRANEFYLKANYSAFDFLKVQASWTRFVADGRPDFVYLPFTVFVDAADVDVQAVFSPIECHRLTLGTGYRFTGFNSEDEDISLGRHSTGLAWVFVQDEITISREFFLTLGARVDGHSESGTSVSPRAALVWEFVAPTTQIVDGLPVWEPGQSFRATVGYGFRDPSLRDLWFDMSIDPTGTTTPVQGGLPKVVGNLDLKPEEIRSFEIGYWGRPTQRLQADCSLFYNLGDHLFAFQENHLPGTMTPDGTASRHNSGSESTWGVEANAEYQLTNEVYTFANYAFEVRWDRRNHDWIPDAPRHKANAGVRVINKDQLSGMLWINFFDRTEFVDKGSKKLIGTVPSYVLVNASIWYPIRVGRADGRVFLQAFNLLDHVHREYIQTDAYGILALAGVEIAW